VTEPKARAKRNEVRQSVMSYLSQNVGIDVTIQQMTADLGFTDSQIRATIYNIRSTSAVLRDEIIVLVSGQMWRYVPIPPVRTPPPPNESIQSPTATTSAPAIAPPASSTNGVTPTRDATTSAPEMILYEKVGEVNGHVIVKGDDGLYYRLHPVNFTFD